MIRPATAADLAEVHRLTQDAARWMVARGIEQWQPDDFLARRVDDVFAHSDTLVAHVGGLVVGSVSIEWEDALGWGEEGEDGRAGYIHVLVGPGYGRLLLDAAEGLIAARGRTLSRLDCVIASQKLRAYYEAAGYMLVRETDFGGRADIPRCGLYEKTLTASRGPRA